MNRDIIFDERWSDFGGIGTFSREIQQIAKFTNANFHGNPISPFDCVRMSFYIITLKAGCIFLPGYIPPLFSKIPYVFTIHDLNHIDRDENSSLLKRIFYKFIIKRGCKKAKKIFTVSEFSRKRIIDWAKIDPQKVINIGNGVSSQFNENVIPKKFDFPYILCVSNRKLHKNEEMTIKSFANAKLSSDYKLVFTGKCDESLHELIIKMDLGDKIFFTGFVEQHDFPSLYKGADALIFISLYEGFGLPIIEAMACGTPVITSRCSSLPEIAGEAALLVNPLDLHEISKAISLLTYDKNLRSELIKKGLMQAKKFTWQATAMKAKANLEQIIYGVS
ncbi:glycosyltransferase family 4 protein [Martelella alba]|nr:glycosyltransferase family 1 protein [Martelella alba]